MAYIIIKVYSFECDNDECDVTNVEVVPAASPLKQDAERQLKRNEHWTIKNGKHFCPKHG